MPEAAKTPQSSEVPAPTGRYFKMQIRGWTDFDPMEKKLPEIAEAIERGGGFLTAIEVLDIKDDPSAIGDNLVREGFQNILAARRVLRNIGALPSGLLQDLRAALNSGQEAARKPVSYESPEPFSAKRAS